MASKQQERSELESMAREGQTVVPGGTGGKSVEAQENLAEGTYIMADMYYAYEPVIS
jgi:hypothetical protein